MFPEQLKKILNLVKKTGDRVVIFDASAPDDSYVVMGFDAYANTLTPAELVDKKLVANNFLDNSQSAPQISEKTPENTGEINKSKNLTEEDLTDKINREISMWKNRDDLSFSANENKPKKAWSIPPQVKEKAQGVE
jgi:hypothetical protein